MYHASHRSALLVPTAKRQSIRIRANGLVLEALGFLQRFSTAGPASTPLATLFNQVPVPFVLGSGGASPPVTLRKCFM